MRKYWSLVALAAVMGSMFIAAPMANAQGTGADSRIDINLKDADLVMATRAITAKTGISFVIEGGGEPFNKVTLQLQGATPEEAIAYVCQAAGVYCRRDASGVYIITRTKPVDAQPTTMVGGAPKTVSMIKKIKVLHQDPRTVYERMIGSLLTTEDSGRVFEDMRRLTKGMTPQDTIRLFGAQNPEAVLDRSGGKPTPMRDNNPGLTGRETGNEIPLPSEAGNQIGGGIGGGGQGGFGGGGQGVGGGGQGVGGGGQGAGNAQLRGGQGLVPSTIDFISYDPTDNSLIVRGTSEDDIAELQRTISLFDQAPKQVLIKVEFITTTQNLSKSLGYDLLYQRGSLFAGNRPGSYANPADVNFLNYATGNLTMRLRTALSEGKGQVVTAPILRTLNNQPASVFSNFTTTIFLPQISQGGGGGGGNVTTYTPVNLNIPTFLTIAPRINDDGYITVFLAPQISNIVGSSRSPDGIQVVPNFVTQGINVVARVRNGETIALAGLTTKSYDNSVSRTPILSDLPIIGQFFKGQSTNKSTSDLLIFVTPTIIEDDDNGG